jgi:glycerate kinase
MRVVLAPDKFKGSLSAVDVARHLADGLLRADPGLDLALVPVGDGGDGTLDAFLAQGYQLRRTTVTGSLGAPRTARYAVRGNEAVIELAEADGLRHVDPTRREPTRATSRGVGELVVAALDEGCRSIVLGLGGSANTDGGAGMVQAFGGRLVDGEGHEPAPGGGALTGLVALDLSGLDSRLADTEVVVATDVDNPLLGPHGAAPVYAPQKGATPDQVRELERGLATWARVVADTTGQDHAMEAGAGAAGGVGFAALAFLRPDVRPGIDVVLETLGFEGMLDGANAVVTGEGSLDSQSLRGKAPVGVATTATRHGVATLAVAGRSLLTVDEAASAGLRAVLALTDIEPDVTVCMRDAGRLLEELGPDLLRRLGEHATGHPA